LRSELEELGAEVWITGQHVIQEAVTYQSHVAELALLMRASGAASVLVNTLGMFVGVDAALQAELPVAWVIHESFALPDFAYLNWGPDGISPVVRKAWLRCIAEASALLFVADATRELFLPYAKPRRCLTVRYGIDLRQTGFGAAADPKAALGIPSDRTVLLTVGVSEPRKGHGPLIASFELVRRRYPHAHLVIVGMHDSPYSNALQDWARDDDHVTLVPLVRDPLPWFRAADLFVNSSDIESLPRTILEAMALDLPVVASDVFGARELIVDGDSGWLFAPNDLNALTVAMLRALGTPAEQRARMAQRAKDHVAPFLDARGYGAEYAAILGKLAQSIGDRG
jgi:glycosyltransferase involved in cell wall biosynthesis